MVSKRKGSSFDDFLKEQDLSNHVEAVALKRIITYQFKKAMEKKHITKKAMAEQMRTSRSELDRLLDPLNTAVTLNTLVRAANSLDKKLSFTFLGNKKL